MNSPNATPAWPVEIRLAKDRRTLHVTFDDGKAFGLAAELLRVTSPSAEVQGHSEAERKTVGGKRNVTILSVDPVGNYAVRLGFDDMHATGIYSWTFLRDLGVNAERRFQDYLDDLASKGLDRDRPGIR
ncbi:DUF971 domain-containing protein [Bradyrhizobium sp.]|uniref:DUF971 domain-containing protein n=1 Tax=Bradyrhizobium sp. TaxID=376 RepID=UPI000ABBA16A|nr:DUF971 domain-containing protein [Bradyrhizobium sp.]